MTLPYPEAPPSARRHPDRYALAFLTLLAASALIVLLISPEKPAGSVIDRHGGTRVTLTARTFEGSPTTPDTLSAAQRIIRSRLAGLGFTRPQIDASDDALTVTVPGSQPELVRNLGETGRLYIRPVINTVPASPTPSQPRKPRDPGRRIAAEKEWRQSTKPAMQLVALQLQARRCGQPDALAGNDDADLPLVTCSTDQQAAYLLAPSIISGDQIQDASSSLNQAMGGYAVNLQFTDAATRTWADFTAAHIGAQIAFTLDSQVVSAPQILEAITNGKTQITGGERPFTADSSPRLASILKYGPLPCSFTTSEPETIAPKEVSGAPWHARLTTWAVLTAAGLLAVLLCAQAYLYRPRRQRVPNQPR